MIRSLSHTFKIQSDACATATVVPLIIEQVRDFIHSALYHPLHGYFSQRSRSVGVLPNAIKFNQLQGAAPCIRLSVILVI